MECLFRLGMLFLTLSCTAWDPWDAQPSSIPPSLRIERAGGLSQMKQCCTKKKNNYPTGYYHLQEYGYLFIFSTLLSIPFYCCSPIRNHGSQKTAPRSPSFIFTSAGYMWKYTASTSYLLEDTKALFWEGSWVEDASMYCVSRLPSPGCMHSSHWASSNITKDCGHSSSLFYLPYYLS